MAALTAAIAAGSSAVNLAGAAAQASALKAQGNYQKSIADTNARFAGIQADDAIKRGESDAQKLDRQGRQVMGRQRASLAAQGIDAGSGSAADVQADTAGNIALDEMTIRNNAWREAWGYKVQAANDTAQGQFSQLSAKNEARNTLITGGLTAANSIAGAYRK